MKEVLKLAREALTSDGWKKAGDAIRAIDEALAQTEQEPCPDKERDEYACKNRYQCWEPCGELGKSEEHVRVAQPEQEPVAHKKGDDDRWDDRYGTGGSYGQGGCYGSSAFTDGDHDGY
jgi:hypothetical protein